MLQVYTPGSSHHQATRRVGRSGQDSLRGVGAGPTDESFRWKQTGRQGLQVEFFCHAGEDRPAARMFRPRADESPTAKLNFGPKLSAFAIDAGEVLPPGNRIPSS